MDTHIQAQYGKSGTWGLMYNLFPAVWLQTGLIEDDVRFSCWVSSIPQYFLWTDFESRSGLLFPQHP
jgi:hypothetical protein